MSSPKEFHFDAVYPEPLSRLRRGHGHSGGLVPSAEAGPTAASYRRAVKKQRMNRSCAGRFRTQPVTFQEIKEVDEENVPDLEPELTATLGKAGAVASTASRSESDLKARFELFYKSINDPSLAEGSGGPIRSPPVAISFPVCPVHSAGASPLCQASCLQQKIKCSEAEGPVGSGALSPTQTCSSSNNSNQAAGAVPGEATPTSSTSSSTNPSFMTTNITAMGARHRQSF